MKENKQHVTDIIFVLSLLCVFAVLALFVVVLGADVYRNISENMAENFNTRTSVTYITEKIRQNDHQGYVEILNVADNDALVITQSLEDTNYETWIYVSDGDLKEAMVKEGATVSPGDGQSIMNVKSMELQPLSAGLVEVTIEDTDGNDYTTTVYMKSGEV